MAARVMGVYASREGMAVAVCSGDKIHHVSWHPSFVQPDGSRLYPAEELHALVASQSPDSTVVYDVDAPVASLPITLPRLKPNQALRALRIELASQSIDALLTPAVGFCPDQIQKEKRRGSLSGFALTMPSEDLQRLIAQYRTLGISLGLVTLPIFPLAFAFMKENEKTPSLLFLVEGELIMIAVIQGDRLDGVEVFVGDDAALEERVRRHLDGTPGMPVYGFEAAAPGARAGVPAWTELFRPLGTDPSGRLLVGERLPLSRETLAVLLARFPGWLGTRTYGGIAALEPETKGGGLTPFAYAAALLVFLLLGAGAIVGTKCWIDRGIDRAQKRTMARLVKTVLPGAPPVASLSLVKSSFMRMKKVQKHLTPFLVPSSLDAVSKALPVLDEMGGVRVRGITAKANGLRVDFEVKHPLDPETLKKTFSKRFAKAKVELARAEGRAARLVPEGRVYSLSIEQGPGKGEASRAQ